MDPHLEDSVKEVILSMYSHNYVTQDQKAKHIVKEMEKRHETDWACMVEPVAKFVQCFGVSKRPDQYIRLICNDDRFRIWRLNEPASDPAAFKALTEECANLQQQLLESNQIREQ